MIKLMIHTTVQKTDKNGNRYSFTSYYTPESRHPFLTTSREYGGGYDALYYALKAGLTHEEIFVTVNDSVPIKEFRSLAANVQGEYLDSHEIVHCISEEVKKSY